MLERIDDVWTNGTHIVFRNMGAKTGQVTNMYHVLAKDNTLLGWVLWFGRWRKYCFFPQPETVYEETCMGEIAQFIVEETKAQRERAKARKAAK